MKKIFAIITFGIAIMISGCASLEDKAVAIGSAVDTLKIETTGSTTSGTLLPNLIMGGAVSAIATSPLITKTNGDKTSSPVYVKVKRTSIFAAIFNLDATTESVCYIGIPGESSDETLKRIEALSKEKK